MPYIKKDDRVKFDKSALEIAQNAECAWDLNYALTTIIHEYVKKKWLRYANLNEVIWMLECCKLELYRKIAWPYEDIAIAKNWDLDILEIKQDKY